MVKRVYESDVRGVFSICHPANQVFGKKRTLHLLPLSSLSLIVTLQGDYVYQLTG